MWGPGFNQLLCIDLLHDKILSISVFRTYGSFTMETILATAFGRVIDIQRGESDDLTRAVDDFFMSIQEGGFFDAYVLVTLFSE